MPTLYIRGLVRAANAVRRDLSHPLSADRRARLRRIAGEYVSQVDAILARNAAALADLPLPTRRAYEFLKTADFDAVPPRSDEVQDARAPRSVTLAGLKSDWDAIVFRLTRPVPAEEAESLLSVIARTSASVERQLSRNGLKPADLTAHSRAARGWLAFFADRENFDAYRAAVARAQHGFETALARARRFRPPASLEFRPISGLFKLRGDRNGTRVTLPTPMISFTQELFQSLAGAALNGGSSKAIADAVMDDEYQNIQAELEVLCGVEEHPAGAHYDLAASFERVNARYFGGGLARPRLMWSRTFTGRKFGHYDPIRDTVVLSSTLDHSAVADFVVDFVMYHELLHKKLGVGWRNGRRTVHTPEFRAAERRFEQWKDAEAAMARLTAGRP